MNYLSAIYKNINHLNTLLLRITPPNQIIDELKSNKYYHNQTIIELNEIIRQFIQKLENEMQIMKDENNKLKNNIRTRRNLIQDEIYEYSNIIDANSSKENNIDFEKYDFHNFFLERLYLYVEMNKIKNAEIFNTSDKKYYISRIKEILFDLYGTENLEDSLVDDHNNLIEKENERITNEFDTIQNTDNFSKYSLTKIKLIFNQFLEKKRQLSHTRYKICKFLKSHNINCDKKFHELVLIQKNIIEKEEKLKEEKSKILQEIRENIELILINDDECIINQKEQFIIHDWKWFQINEKNESSHENNKHNKFYFDSDNSQPIIADSTKNIAKIPDYIINNQSLNIFMLSLDQLTELNELIKKKFKNEFENIFMEIEKELKEISDIFNLNIPKLKRNRESVFLMKKIIFDLKERKNEHKRINNLILIRLNKKEELEKFEKEAKNPSRLKGSSIRLLEEEKYRKRMIYELLVLEKEISNELNKYEERWNDAFYYKNDNYNEILKNEINSRILTSSIYTKKYE